MNGQFNAYGDGCRRSVFDGQHGDGDATFCYPWVCHHGVKADFSLWLPAWVASGDAPGCPRKGVPIGKMGGAPSGSATAKGTEAATLDGVRVPVTSRKNGWSGERVFSAQFSVFIETRAIGWRTIPPCCGWNSLAPEARQTIAPGVSLGWVLAKSQAP